jgi:hypothetical protein
MAAESRHLGFTNTGNISGMAWPIYIKLSRSSQFGHKYIWDKFWPFNSIIQDGGCAAILDLALHAISRTPLEGFEPNLARCHKGSLPMFWLSFDLLT